MVMFYAMKFSFLRHELFLFEELPSGQPYGVKFYHDYGNSNDNAEGVARLSREELAESLGLTLFQATTATLENALVQRGWTATPVSLVELVNLMYVFPTAFSDTQRRGLFDHLLDMLHLLSPKGLHLGLRAAKEMIDAALAVPLLNDQPESAEFQTPRAVLHQHNANLIGMIKVMRKYALKPYMLEWTAPDYVPSPVPEFAPDEAGDEEPPCSV